jgi:crossover junction endodeoxyribonuclease RuvC
VKILGIDPSLRSTGFGVIESKGNQLTALCHGHVKNAPAVLPSRCLVIISDAMLKLIADYQPEAAAIEGLVYVQNTRIAFTLGQVRGVIIAAAAKHDLPIYEYAPRKVKQSVTGMGGAGKNQVGNMIKVMLGLKEAPQTDAGDALAVAICHANNTRGIQVKPPKQI